MARLLLHSVICTEAPPYACMHLSSSVATSRTGHPLDMGYDEQPGHVANHSCCQVMHMRQVPWPWVHHGMTWQPCSSPPNTQPAHRHGRCMDGSCSCACGHSLRSCLLLCASGGGWHAACDNHLESIGCVDGGACGHANLLQPCMHRQHTCICTGSIRAYAQADS